mmetsp:Transcript_62686/g.202175  ORF Transcript_62686/g.202175 Transcript_62686/m.202175 type:complete len:231 (+) Transcript_62686:174-866(+)
MSQVCPSVGVFSKTSSTDALAFRAASELPRSSPAAVGLASELAARDTWTTGSERPTARLLQASSSWPRAIAVPGASASTPLAQASSATGASSSMPAQPAAGTTASRPRAAASVLPACSKYQTPTARPAARMAPTAHCAADGKARGAPPSPTPVARAVPSCDATIPWFVPAAATAPVPTPEARDCPAPPEAPAASTGALPLSGLLLPLSGPLLLRLEELGPFPAVAACPPA